MKILGRRGLALLLLPILSACGSAPPAAAPAKDPEETRYTYILSGNRAGSATSRPSPGGWWTSSFEYNDRGRGPKLASRIRLDERGIPVLIENRGVAYFKNPVEERFELAGGRATWKSTDEEGEQEVDGPAFYLSRYGSPEEGAMLARALLNARGRRLDLLPEGEARIEEVGTTQASAGGISRTVHLYAISGLGFTPTYLWLDDQRKFFATTDGWSVVILEGWESAAPALAAYQERVTGERAARLARELARRPERSLVIRGARLFDPATTSTVPDTTVVIEGNRIRAVGRDGEVEIPRRAEVIDARGKALLPGLWDMHVHIGADQGILHLASGVTSTRDMANDIDQLADLRRRFDAGEAIGPRLFLAGFMDGPGPYAGPTKILVDTEEEARQAIDRYAELGYQQIKVYSSIDPKLMPAILERAHGKGLRVSGHIPQGMTAEQAVRAGFDEIQHMNFLFLNFLGQGLDTRTPARFTAVAENGAKLDLQSPEVRSFLALLKERKTVIDPTLSIFEDMFTTGPGELSAGWEPVIDRMPATIQRGLRGGGLSAPEGKAQQYRDSYRAMLRMAKMLYDQGIPIVAGTDSMPGFALHRELELYAQAGIPAGEVLRIATLGAAQVARQEKDLGTIEPGKLADLILVDGDPAGRISDIRRVVLTVKDGVVYEPNRLWESIGVKPVEERR
ncbi:MAG TPA: amidohydrolase family protein [Thermoanaerobaculia bacterium]|nr:amidohydrolase family protein [Thermoanaerobaculia bacterium]